MPTLRTRAGKGSALTHAELDANFTRPVDQKTTTYSCLASDNRSLIEGNHASTPFTITLGAATTMDNAESGDYEISFSNIGAAAVTIARAGADTIDGAATSIVLQTYESISLKTNNAGDGYQSIGSSAKLIDQYSPIPSGTTMLFYQTAAPAGWTKDTTAGLNDHALRVMTSGAWTGGTQGTTAFSTQFAQGFAGEGFQLLETHIPAHAHYSPYATSVGSAVPRLEDGSNRGTTGSRIDGESVGGDTAHAHDVNLGVKYLDVIIAAKD